ncbi:MAG: hypothetical protein KDA72_00595 [Planctomycetales bacterium]|nr:hypothetical protein [Planctomycetales bacterium]
MNRTAQKPASHYIPSLNYSRRDFYRQISRHYKKSIAVFLLVVSAAMLFSFLAPSVYQSQSILYVRLGRENVRLDPTATFGQTAVMTIPNSRESEINTAVEILKSRALAEKVVEALGPALILEEESSVAEASSESLLRRGVATWRDILEQLRLTTPLSKQERAIDKLRKNFSAQTFNKTDLLSISYRGSSPELAQRVVAKFTELYLDEHAGLNRTPNSLQFLEQQTERLRVELTEAEQRLSDLKQETELAAPDSQRELMATRLSRLQDELLSADTLVVSTKSEVAALHATLKELSATQVATTVGLSNPAADGMRQLLYGLQLQEKKLAGKVTEDHPELKSIREQIVQSQAILSKEQEARSTVTEAPNRAYEELSLACLQQEVKLASTQAKANSLREQIADAKKLFQTQIESELRIATLQREVQLQDISYRKYTDNLEQAQIDHALEAARISNINVVQPATFIERPISPKILLNLIAGLFGGVVAAIGLAIFCDVIDHSLKTPEEIEEKLKLPLLVSIPRLDRRQLALNGRDRA